MIAVPGATHILATQGAEIIKIENTTGGDDLRMYGSRKSNMSGWFANANAGKRSIGLNLEKEEAKEILRSFIKDADVFIEGFRPVQYLVWDFRLMKLLKSIQSWCTCHHLDSELKDPIAKDQFMIRSYKQFQDGRVLNELPMDLPLSAGW